MPDGWETANGLNPNVSGGSGDADADGLTDLQEFVAGTNPHASDTDGDTMPDLYEVTYHLDTLHNDANQDHDGDSLTNLQEYTMGTNPNSFDSDGDLLPDWWEIQNGLNPNSSAGVNGQNGDDDSDGVLNLEEYLNGTSPHSGDSDGDTVSDRTEIDQGSDPLDPTDGGQPPPTDKMKSVPFHIYGDYASWEMTIVGQGPDDQRTLKLITNAPGQADSKTLKLRKGNKYEIRMRWTKSLVDSPKWYCWEAQCDGFPTVGTFDSYSSTRKTGVAEFFPVGGCWLMDNRGGLLTSHVHMNDDYGGNVAGSLTATLLPVEVESVEFTSDHNILIKNPTTGSVWDDGNTLYESPEWIADSQAEARNNPISHTKDQNLSVKVKVKGLPPGIPFDLVGDGPDDYVDFLKTGQTSTAGETEVVATATAKLPDLVSTLEKTINWSVKINGVNCNIGASGAHKIYVTYGTPSGSVVTERRVREVCAIADGMASLEESADAVFNGLSGSFVLTASIWGPSPIWLLHDPTKKSQCPGIADYVNKNFQMLGLGAGEISYCHAKPDGTYEATTSLIPPTRRAVAGGGHPYPTVHGAFNSQETLVHWDGSNPPGANDFEATCFFNNKHYALGVGIFTTAKDVVKTSFTSISWEYVGIDNPGPPETYKFKTCTEVPWVEAP